MKIKFSLKLSLLLFFTILPCIASSAIDALENAKIRAGVEYLTTEHSTRRNAFIDAPVETSQESVNTTNIITLLSDKTKVSKIEATEDQKRTIATSVMATIFIHNGKKKLNRNHLKDTDALYRHFRALELIEDLSVQLNGHLIDVDGFKTVDTTHLSTIWHNFSDLYAYSKITKVLFELWFNEALAAHNGGFIKLAEIARKTDSAHVESTAANEVASESTSFTTPKKRLFSDEEAEYKGTLPPTPSTRRKTEAARTNTSAPFQNGHTLKTQIKGEAIQFLYYRVSDESNDQNYLGLHMTKSDFESRIKAAKLEDLQDIYQQMMNESRELSEEKSEDEDELSAEDIIEAFVNYYLGTGQLKMASTVLTDTPLCVWRHENQTLALQSIFLNGNILSADSVITSIHERIKKLDESLIHLYHTNDDFYDSLELVKKKNTNAFKQEPIVRRSYFSNQIQVKALTAVGLTTFFAFAFERYAPGMFANIFSAGIKFLPGVFRGFFAGKK